MIKTKNNLTERLTVLAKKRYTGILKVRASKVQQWKIYLRLGRLVWIDGGYHPERSWQRHLAKYCPKVGMSKIKIDSFKNVEYCKYQYLAILFEQKLIDKAQIKGIVNSIILENLFEILQQEDKKVLDYSLETAANSPVLVSVLNIAFTLVDVEKSLKQARDSWQTWKEKGLVNCDRNLAPRIKNKSKLKQEVSEVVYNNFITFIDGNNTLQDLAFRMNSETFKVACSLVKYIRQGLLELVKVGDLEKSEKIVRSPENSIKTNHNNTGKKKLIVAIDDSKVICHIMKEIVDSVGQDFISIQHPLQAIPTLIGIKPDLIFLDLAMPIINGYEICSQIRRISLFKKIPIIIVTANNGLVEKAKSKAVGATDFLSKPINEEAILKTLDRYLILDRKQADNLAVQKIKTQKKEKIHFVTPRPTYAGV